MFNNHYFRYARIGSGHHGEVFLCFRIDNRFAGNDGRQWFPVVRPPLLARLLACSSSCRVFLRPGNEIR